MTKEEAIKVLEQVRQWTDYPKEAFTMAIEALSQLSVSTNFNEAAEHGEIIEGEVVATSTNGWESVRLWKKLHSVGDKVIVQIRKK